MTHSIYVDLKVPIPPEGWAQLKINLGDLDLATQDDRSFILDIIERLGRIAGRNVTPPEVPAVLRGVVGARA